MKIMREGVRLAKKFFSPSTVSSKSMVELSSLMVSDADIATVRPFFDSQFYLEQYPDVALSGLDPVRHYLQFGWKERRDPSPNFSTDFYLKAYSDIAEYGLNPFLHYVIAGRKEGRRGHPNGKLSIFRSSEASSIDPKLSIISRLEEAKSSTSTNQTTAVDVDRLNIHWVIPDFARGGGGHMTIFRMVHLLESFGHKCTIWIFGNTIHQTADDAYQDIIKYFQCVGAEIKITNDGRIDASGDALIATGWDTAYAVAAAQNFREKFYFVQDHEPEFYSTGTNSLLAKQTYNFDLACICAGEWLKELMSEKYGRWARSFNLAYDKEIYSVKSGTAEAENTRRLKIAVYAREATSRRCVSLALTALDILADERDDFEVHFFGQERLPFNEVKYRAWNHGVLDGTELAALYNDCDLGLCFSSTNYSLVPQEMMACGLPLVELEVESTTAIFPSDVVMLAGPMPIDIKNKISLLLSSEDLRTSQAAKALDWVHALTWEGSARAVEAALRERLGLSISDDQKTEKKLLDVVIPTYNGIGEIERVIQSLRSQTMYSQMNIYCIDSTSQDGTAEWLKAQKDVFLVSVTQAEFQHGRTRNLGASLGTSPYIAFLTQDAVPATKYWANDICRMMEHYETAAGLFGRHLPYPEHSGFVRDDITKHFEGMLDFPLLLSKNTDEERWANVDLGWRQLLHYYSDNNSCMRRSVWEKIPYPNVDFGEDQIWAKSIIEAGYAKIYAPTATVFHSHDFGPEETYKRSEIESRFFYEFFGYEMAPTSEAQLQQIIASEQKDAARTATLLGVSLEELSMRKNNILQKHSGWFHGMMNAKKALSERVNSSK